MKAFLDESGNTTPFHEGQWFLLIVVLVANDKATHALDRHVRRLRSRIGKSISSGEVKAVTTDPRLRRRFLHEIAGEDIAIVAIALDKRCVLKPPKDPEDWYRMAVTRAVRRCVSLYPELHLRLDKRYTQRILRDRLDREIADDLRGLPCSVRIEHTESHANRPLQAADLVAWAVYRKWELGDTTEYDLIKSKIVVEEQLVVR